MKKILCMSLCLILALGLLTACGSSTNQKSIMTEVPVGKSTVSDMEAYLKTNNVNYEIDTKYNSITTKNTMSFLDHEAQLGYLKFDPNNTIIQYRLEIRFKDYEDYNKNVKLMQDYFMGFTNGIHFVDSESKENIYLVEDNENYFSAIKFYTKSYEASVVPEGYYNTTVCIVYGSETVDWLDYNRFNSTSYDEEWLDSKGNKYDLKFYTSNEKTIEELAKKHYH